MAQQRHHAGGNPAAGTHEDNANPAPAPSTGNDFPDAPAGAADESASARPPDQPDLDRFAAAIGTDRLARIDDTKDTRGARGTAAAERLRDWRTPVSSALGGAAHGARRLAGRLGEVAERLTGSGDDDQLDLAAVRDRVDGVRTSMVTTVDERGTLSSRPLTVQRISPEGDLIFVVARAAEWVSPTMDAVNVALVDGDRTWVSVSGRAVVREDRPELDDLWGPLLDSFFPDGPESAAVLQVQADRWEYWAAPNKLSQALEMVTATVRDTAPDLGSSGTIET